MTGGTGARIAGRPREPHRAAVTFLRAGGHCNGRLTHVPVLPTCAHKEHERLPIREQLLEFRILHVESVDQDGDGLADQVLHVDFRKSPLAEVRKGLRTRLRRRV